MEPKFGKSPPCGAPSFPWDVRTPCWCLNSCLWGWPAAAQIAVASVQSPPTFHRTTHGHTPSCSHSHIQDEFMHSHTHTGTVTHSHPILLEKLEEMIQVLSSQYQALSVQNLMAQVKPRQAHWAPGLGRHLPSPHHVSVERDGHGSSGMEGPRGPAWPAGTSPPALHRGPDLHVCHEGQPWAPRSRWADRPTSLCLVWRQLLGSEGL